MLITPSRITTRRQLLYVTSVRLYSNEIPKKPLVERIQTDVKEALKSRDKIKAMVLRGLLSDITYASKASASGSSVNIPSIIHKAVAKRKEAATQYEAAGRADLAENEEFESKLLSVYLPQQLSQVDLEELVRSSITEENVQSERDIGKVIKNVMSKVEDGSTTGKAVSAVAKDLIKGLSKS